jgi:hypothetical protein
MLRWSLTTRYLETGSSLSILVVSWRLAAPTSTDSVLALPTLEVSEASETGEHTGPRRGVGRLHQRHFVLTRPQAGFVEEYTTVAQDKSIGKTAIGLLRVTVTNRVTARGL